MQDPLIGIAADLKRLANAAEDISADLATIARHLRQTEAASRSARSIADRTKAIGFPVPLVALRRWSMISRRSDSMGGSCKREVSR
jgi:hypothetical protein